MIKKSIQVARRVYSDLVKRRTSVRLKAAAEPAMKGDPIFVVGLFRSGTTLMRYVVDSHSKIACPPETRFMAHLSHLVSGERCSQGMLAMGYDRAHVAQKLRGLICYFMENYAASKNKPRWADKTPEYVSILPFLQEVFPTAKFIMLYRHPMDQVHSNVKSGLGIKDRIGSFANEVDTDYIAGSRYWVEQTERMIEFEKAFPDATHRIRYEDMCENPEDFLRPMFDFLGEEWEPEVLEYYKFEHDYGAEDGKVATTRAISRSVHDPSKWDSSDLDASIKLVKETAEKLNYEIPEVSIL